MSHRDLEPLAPEIADLLAAERRAPAPPAARKEMILSRVEAAVSIGAGVATSAAGAQAALSAAGAAAAGAEGAKVAVLALPLSKVWIAVVTMSAIGIGAGAALYQRADRRHGSAAPADGAPGGAATASGLRPARAAISPPSRPAAPSVLRAPPAVASAPARPWTGSTAGSAAGSAAATATGDIVAESALLEGARRALVDGDVRGALARVAQHARLFQRGLLIEEREALWVKALVLAGDRGAARARAAAFYRRFPGTIQRDAIDRALATTTESSGRGQ